MITYLYWVLVFIASATAYWLLDKFHQRKVGIILAALILLVSWGAYHFYYEQYFVKNYGGVMSVTVPKGQMHILATWKDDHLWIENYDPKTNICYFNEYSRGHVLQGQVEIENCNPTLPGVINKP